MRFPLRTAILAVLLQVVCLAVGLWMHHHQSVKALNREVEEETWKRIETLAQDGVGRFGSVTVRSYASNPETFRADLDGLQHTLTPYDELSLLDAQGRVVLRWVAGQPDPMVANGESIHWEALVSGPTGRAARVRGTVCRSDGPGIAARVPVNEGHLLVSHPLHAIAARATALAKPLTLIGLITLVWTTILFSVAIFVIVGRLWQRAAAGQARMTTDALRQVQRVVRTREAVILGLAKLAESRDSCTGGHLERIASYTAALAAALRRDPRYAAEITPAFVRLIRASAVLHDIGKVGIEDRILLKCGSLTPDERARIQQHTRIGGDCLLDIERRLGGSNFLQMAREIALAHHERWDGGGYPDGLKGEEIPLAARIVTIADVYDALSTRRPYKEAQSHTECVAAIRSQSGKAFDPNMVKIWLAIEAQFARIASRYAVSAERKSKADPEGREYSEFDGVIEAGWSSADDELASINAEA